jgi:hypothetical protein
MNRWVPVEPLFVAPDGLSYIINGPGGFYRVDAVTGSRRQVSGDGPDGARGSWTVAAYDGANLYLFSAGIATLPGLWIVKVGDDSIRRIGGNYYWPIVGSGLAWTTDPKSPTDLLRLDIATGSITRSVATSSNQAVAFGTLGKQAVLRIDDPNSRRLLITDGTTRREFPVPGNVLISAVYASRPGLWVSLYDGQLALLSGSGELNVVAYLDVFSIAGGCW